MEENWDLDANAPSFSLFEKVTPEQASKNDIIDPYTYQRWSPAERRLFQKLRCDKIKKLLKREDVAIMDLTQALADLNMFKADEEVVQENGGQQASREDDGFRIEDLIGQVERMKIRADTRA